MSKKQKMTAVVLSQEKIAEDIYSMWLKAEPIAAEAVPGQFISMYTNDGGKLLPRPISLCEIDQEKGALRVVYRVTGKQTGTEQFSLMKEGDTLDVMGPLGNGFDLETGREKKAMLFGGGIGVPPMLELAKQLKAGYQTECQLVMGYRSETFLTKELEENGTLYIATEDGSTGTKGNVMDAVAANSLEADVIYACGPTPMLRAIKQYAEENKIECYISMEERMACGVGACLGVSVSPKKWITTVMFITNVSAKTDRYFWRRRWNCNGYAGKDCRCRVEQSGDSGIRNIWIRGRIQ